MKNKSEVETIEKRVADQVDLKPYLKFQEKIDEATGKRKGNVFALSDGSDLENLNTETSEKIVDALKRATGAQHPELALKVLDAVAEGMLGATQTDRLNSTASMLPMLKPKDETEALLLGQFVSLQEAGRKCIRQANSQEQFYHLERLFLLATKLFAQANATMQTLLKYRTGGQQTVQVVHLHNQGQAIVAQTLSSPEKVEGRQEKKYE